MTGIEREIFRKSSIIMRRVLTSDGSNKWMAGNLSKKEARLVLCALELAKRNDRAS